jgi:hypothetical protein
MKEINILNKNDHISSSHLIIIPKVLKVGHGNKVLVVIDRSAGPVKIIFKLTLGRKQFEGG